MRGDLFYDVPLIPSEKVPPCPECTSLKVVIMKCPDDVDRAWCNDCDEVWTPVGNDLPGARRCLRTSLLF